MSVGSIRCHIDLTVDDVDAAIVKIIAIGGTREETTEYLSSSRVVSWKATRDRLGCDDRSVCERVLSRERPVWRTRYGLPKQRSMRGPIRSGARRAGRTSDEGRSAVQEA